MDPSENDRITKVKADALKQLSALAQLAENKRLLQEQNQQNNAINSESYNNQPSQSYSINDNTEADEYIYDDVNGQQPSNSSTSQENCSDDLNDQNQDDELFSQIELKGCCSFLKVFLRHTIKTMKRNFCHFCLAFLAVMIVVWTALVIQTLTAQSPLIFMKLAEMNKGEYDGSLVPIEMADSNLYTKAGYQSTQLNFTRIKELSNGEQIAPRLAFTYSSYMYYPNYTVIQDFSYIAQVSIDTEMEAEIGVGKDWPFEPLGYRECLLQQSHAEKNNITIDDVILQYGYDMDYQVFPIIHYYNTIANQSGWATFDAFTEGYYNVQRPMQTTCVVKGFINETYGKFDKLSDSHPILVFEFKHFLKSICDYVNQIHFNMDFQNWIDSNPDIFYSFTNYAIYKLPEPRTSFYKSASYSTVQENVLSMEHDFLYNLGYYPVTIQNNLLEFIKDYSLVTMLFGLIFDIVIVLFSTISILLIYSLLMITVQSKAHESGIMRLMGLSQKGFTMSILLQSLFFVIPSIICGYILSFPTLYFLYQKVLHGEQSTFGVSVVPSAQTTLISFGLGIFIPFISSIIPIRFALKNTLVEALDTKRQKITGIKIIVDEGQETGTYLVMGSLIALYGVSVYYLLPYAIVHLDVSLLLLVFFGVILASLVGLAMIASNFQRLFEVLIVKVLLFWEEKAMKILILKNLIIHKERNMLTSMTQTLTIISIVFVLTMLNLELLSFTEYKQFHDIDLYADIFSTNITAFEDILIDYKDGVEDFGYVTWSLTTTQIKDIQGHGSIAQSNPYMEGYTAISPSKMMDKVIRPMRKNQTSGLPACEQLYTARGSQGFAMSTMMMNRLYQDPNNWNSTAGLLFYKQTILEPDLAEQNQVVGSYSGRYVRSIYEYANTEFNSWNHFNLGSNVQMNAMMSIPQQLFYFNVGIEHVFTGWFGHTFIELKDPQDTNFTSNLTGTLCDQMGMCSITDNTINGKNQEEIVDEESTKAKIERLLNFTFGSILLITIFLCFFALSSNMTANLFEQAKEIAVLRSIGWKNQRIRFLYFYEAFTLVLSSSFLGMVVGIIVGYMFILQQSLILQSDIPFYFPTSQFILIVFLSIICAFFSTIGPAISITKKEIAEIFRII